MFSSDEETGDTDVVVFVVHHFHQLKLSELWIGFRSGMCPLTDLM